MLTCGGHSYLYGIVIRLYVCLFRYETLVNLTRNYPELCTATIGQWCCEASDETRAVIEADNKTVCPESPDADDSPFGLFQLAQDPVECAAMQVRNNASRGCNI